MSRDALIAKLERYDPIDDADRSSRDRLLAFVRGEPGCFERSLLDGHITASSWIVDASGERVLLTHHRKLGKWLQLGGHADGDPDVIRVALREAAEESGLRELSLVSEEIFDLDIHGIPAREDAGAVVPGHLHYDVRFAFRAGEEDAFTVSEESLDLAWIPIESLERYSDERSLLRMKEKWLLRAADSFSGSGTAQGFPNKLRAC